MNQELAFDYQKLYGKIKEKSHTQSSLADTIGISLTSLNEKLNNKKMFTQVEIIKMCEVLGIKAKELPEYFFTEKVRKNERKTT